MAAQPQHHGSGEEKQCKLAIEKAKNALSIVEKAFRGETNNNRAWGTDTGGSTAYANYRKIPDFSAALTQARSAKRLLEPYKTKTDGAVIKYIDALQKIAICHANLKDHKSFVDIVIEFCDYGRDLKTESRFILWSSGLKDLLKEVTEDLTRYPIESLGCKTVSEVLEEKAKAVYSLRTFQGQFQDPPVSQDLDLNSLAVIFLLCFSNEQLCANRMPIQAKEIDQKNKYSDEHFNVKDVCENCLKILDRKLESTISNTGLQLRAAFSSVLSFNAVRRKKKDEAFNLLANANKDILNTRGSPGISIAFKRVFLESRCRVLSLSDRQSDLEKAADDIQTLVQDNREYDYENSDINGSYFQRKDNSFVSIKRANLFYRLGLARLAIGTKRGTREAKSLNLKKFVDIIQNLERFDKSNIEDLLCELDLKRIDLSLKIAKAEQNHSDVILYSKQMLEFYTEDWKDQYKLKPSFIGSVVDSMLDAIVELQEQKKAVSFADLKSEIKERKREKGWIKDFAYYGVIAASRAISKDPYLKGVDLPKIWLGLGLAAVKIKDDKKAKECEDALEKLSGLLIAGDFDTWVAFKHAEARIANSRGAVAKATRLLDEVLVPRSNYTLGHEYRGDLFALRAQVTERDGVPQKALPFYEKAVKEYLVSQDQGACLPKIKKTYEKLVRICLLLKEDHTNDTTTSQSVELEQKVEPSGDIKVDYSKKFLEYQEKLRNLAEPV